MFDLPPAVLISGLLIGATGFAMFIWGKNQQDFPILTAGFVLGVMPMLVTSVLTLWLVTAAIFAGVWVHRRYAG